MFEKYLNGVDWVSERHLLSSNTTMPNSAVIYAVSRYPSKDLLRLSDVQARDIMPPLEMWDEYRAAGKSGNRGAGWHRFEGKYLEYLNEDEKAYKKCQQIKAQGEVRPVFIAGGSYKASHSEARLCSDFINNVCELPSG